MPFLSIPNRCARRSLSALLLTAGLVVATTAAQAAITWHDIQFGGFVSQGYLKSTDNNYPVDTQDGTFDFREYAVNASTTFGSHFRIGGQLFAQKLGKYGDDKVILDWAVADYNFCPEFGLRAGRVKYPRSLHSDVLDADVLRPFIFLPQSMYDARLRDFQASFDGGMAYGSLAAGKNAFDYKVFYGDIPMKTDSGLADFFNTTSLFANPPGVKQLGLDSVYGATLAWTTPVPGLRLSAYYSVLKHLQAAGQFAAIPAFGSSIDLEKIEYSAASAEYTKDKWTFVGEYMLQQGDSQVTLPSFIPKSAPGKFGTRSYYVSAARRLNDKLEVGAYYTHIHNSYPTTAPTSADKRNDWTVSGRYDLNDHLLFKLEVHFINGTRDIFNVQGISNPPASMKDSMTLFAAKTTFSF